MKLQYNKNLRIALYPPLGQSNLNHDLMGPNATPKGKGIASAIN